MDAQLKFNQLFEQLRAEVGKLIKQKEGLEQDIATKLARQTYLQDAIADLETKRTESEQATSDALAANVECLADDKQQLHQLQAEYDVIREQVAAGEQKIATLQQVAASEVRRLDDFVQAKIQEKDQLTADIDQEIANKQQALQRITSELKDSQQTATGLDGQLATKATEVSSEISKLDADLQVVRRRHQDVVSQLDDKQDELKQLTDKLAGLQADIAAVATAQAEFEQYKERAMKALEAREGAILDREAVLQNLERRQQPKSTSILDNL